MFRGLHAWLLSLTPSSRARMLEAAQQRGRQEGAELTFRIIANMNRAERRALVRDIVKEYKD